MTAAPMTATSKRLEMIEKMLAAGSKDPFHHYARAMELRSLERLEDARLAFADVSVRFPDYVPAYLMRAQVAVELGLHADAKEACERGVVAAQKAGDDKASGELEALLATVLGTLGG